MLLCKQSTSEPEKFIYSPYSSVPFPPVHNPVQAHPLHLVLREQFLAFIFHGMDSSEE